MKIFLHREYLRDCTAGLLRVGSTTLATIERPWIPTAEHIGGKNKESCIPEGEYEVKPYTSPKFPGVWSVVNPALAVYLELPIGAKGRSHILIHVGNTVADVIGCIAVGLTRSSNHKIVTRSKLGVDKLHELLGKESHTLVIGSVS